MPSMSDDLPTPSILIDAAVVRRNLRRLADYAKSHRLNLRPHTKTHKSTLLARMQMETGRGRADRRQGGRGRGDGRRWRTTC